MSRERNQLDILGVFGAFDKIDIRTNGAGRGGEVVQASCLRPWRERIKLFAC